MKKNTHRIFALLIAGVMLLSACGTPSGGGAATSAPADSSAVTNAPNAPAPAPAAPDAGNDTVSVSAIGDTLTVCLDGEPQSFLPIYGTPTKPEVFIQRSLFNSLYEYDENGELVPSLATDYEWIDDLHIKLFMREGVIAYDGTELTAHDVIYSFTEGHEHNGVNNYTTYINIENCYAEDDYTVVLELATVYGDILYVLTDIAFCIASESSIEASGGVDANSTFPRSNTGRYNFVEMKPGQYVKLEYNENYWDKSWTPAYKYIMFTWVPDSASRTLTVQSGGADVALEVSYADIIAFLNNPDFTVHSAQNSKIVAINFNCTEESIFNNELLREAVYKCVDAESCMQILFGDYTSTIETCVSSMLDWYYKPDAPERKVDYDRARECLEEAGYPNGFEFTLLIEPTAGFSNVAELIQASLLNVGIKMNLLEVDLPSFFAQRNSGDFDAFLCNSSRYIVAASAVKGWDGGRYTFAQASGGSGYHSEELNKYIDVVYSTVDPAARTEALNTIQQWALDHYLGVGICNSVSFCVTPKEITNFVIRPDGYPYVYFFKPVS